MALLASGTCVMTEPAVPAEVTPQRLVNADKEPQNWLMNHRTYDGQRFSPLARINKDNVKGLKLAYAVPLGGGAGNEWIQATPLAEDGFLYITDSWGVVYKIDGTSGDGGRIVWRMDPKQQKQSRNRGATLWGNLVVTAASGPPRIIATDKETGHWPGNPRSRIRPRSSSPQHRSPSTTRSSSAQPVAIKECAIGLAVLMPGAVNGFGRDT
jgi:alcohol dehydrogenase (cytochrome c)